MKAKFVMHRQQKKYFGQCLVYHYKIKGIVCATTSDIQSIYHTSWENAKESMEKPCSSLLNTVFCTTSHMRIRISTINYATICIRYCKSRVLYCKRSKRNSQYSNSILVAKHETKKCLHTGKEQNKTNRSTDKTNTRYLQSIETYQHMPRRPIITQHIQLNLEENSSKKILR